MLPILINLNMQDKLSRLQSEHNTLLTTSASNTTKLERTKLQLDGAQTANAELQHLNEDLKRTNAELKRQLDEWQNLETKGEVHAENLRKKRSELEIRAKDLESKLVESEKKLTETEKAKEKEVRRVEKAKAAYIGWKVKYRKKPLNESADLGVSGSS
jgi:chromosome segregation ATPase